MSGISTHVLDTSRGQPAEGIVVVLEVREAAAWTELGRGTTNADGRVSSLSSAVSSGDYRLRFEVEPYFVGLGLAVFYPEVTIHVRLDEGGKYHLPLLLTPFGYSTYRGS